MSDWYFALIDTSADASKAQDRADRFVIDFVSRGILLSEANDECVYGIGYPPGPRLNELYELEGQSFQSVGICGVEDIVGKYVNQFGLVVFDYAKCPDCRREFNFQSAISGPLGDAIGAFLQEDQPAMLRCPGCDVERKVQHWITKPHLGFCHLAIQFWNWPDFDAKGWRISIPELASNAIGAPLIVSYGRM